MFLILCILLKSVSDSTCSLIKMDTMHSQEGIFTIRILHKKLKNLILLMQLMELKRNMTRRFERIKRLKN